MERPQPLPDRHTFAPRFFPRDKYDWRLSVTVTLLLTPAVSVAAALWLLLPPALVGMATHNEGWVIAAFWLMWLLWMSYFLLLPVRRVEVSEEGIRVKRGLRTRLIPWDKVQSVSRVSRTEALKLVARPQMWTGKYAAPGSLTFADYVCVRHHGGGALYFPPEDVEAFLAAIRRFRLRENHHRQGQSNLDESNQVPETTRWYWNAHALREENRQNVRLRGQ